MASSNYFIKIKTPYNIPVLNVNEFYKIELFRSEYGVGSLYVDFPLKEFINRNIDVDWRLEVYRRTAGGELVRVGDTQWIVKLVRYKVDENNNTSLHIIAYDMMYLLNKRIVAYVDGTPQTSKTMPADDMLKAIVRENLGSLASDYHRDLSEWLVVEADSSIAPVVTKSQFGMQMILPVLNDICQLSEAAGMYLSYDIVYDESTGKLIFKTYTQQRGANHGSNSSAPIYLAHHTDPVNIMGSGLDYASIEIDATDERSYVYSGRQAEDVNAIFVEIENKIATNVSPLARAEDFITTGESLEYNDMMTEAHAWLQHKFRNLILNAHIQETNDMQFGIDYGFGDILALRYLGTTFNIHLDEFKIIVEGDGKEDISVTSTNTEKELLIPPLTGLNAPPLVKNEPIEGDGENGAQLFYKYHTIAQSFVLNSQESIDYVEIMMRRSGLPERNVSVRIARNNGPDGMPGTIIGAADPKPFYRFADGIYTWQRFEFDSPLVLDQLTTYWLIVTCGITKAEEENYYLVRVDPETRYEDGILRVSTDGATFTKFTEYAPSDKGWEDANADIPFHTYKAALADSQTVINSTVLLNSTGMSVGQKTQLSAPPGDPGVFKITNVIIKAKRRGFPDSLRVELCDWDAAKSKPGEAFASVSISAGDISDSTFTDYDFWFSEMPLLLAGTPFCINITSDYLSAYDYYELSINTAPPSSPGSAYEYKDDVCTFIGADLYFMIYRVLTDIMFTQWGNDCFDVGKTNSGLMQTFQVGAEARLAMADIYVGKIGTPTDDLNVSFYELLDDQPHTQLTGFTIDRLYVSNTPAWHTGLLNGATLYPGKTYGIWMSSAIDENNYYTFKYDPNKGYPNGKALIDKIESTQADADMFFRIGKKLP